MLDLDALMAFLLLPTLQNWLLRHVRSGTPLIVKLQKMHSSPLDGLCILCATLGNEFSLLLLLPLIAWNLDMTLGRKMILLWGIGFYTSNYLKDLLRLPRPSEVCDEVVTLPAGRWAGRGGLPCTRAFSCTALPFYLLFTTHEQYDYSFGWGLSLALAWCVLVAFSRIYLGLHSPTDVLAGMILAGLFVYVWLLVGDDVDRFLTHPNPARWWLPCTEPLVAWLLLLAYPAPLNCSLAFTETAAVGGFATGWMMGSSWLFHHALLSVLPLAVLGGPHPAAAAVVAGGGRGGGGAALLCVTSECLWLMGIRSTLGLALLCSTLIGSMRLALLPRLPIDRRYSSMGSSRPSFSLPPHESLAACRAMRAALLQRQQEAGTSSHKHHHQQQQLDGAALFPSWYLDGLINGSSTTHAVTTNGDVSSKPRPASSSSLPHHHHPHSLGLQHPKKAVNHHSNGVASFPLPLSSTTLPAGSSSSSGRREQQQQAVLPRDALLHDPAKAAPYLLSLWSIRLLAEKATPPPPLTTATSTTGSSSSRKGEGCEAAQQAYYTEVVVPSVLFTAYLLLGFLAAFCIPMLLRVGGLMPPPPPLPTAS